MARRPSTDDVIRLGADIAGIKAGMSKRKWRKFVKAAHGRGITVRGALSDVPEPLKERTHTSLRAQAAKTVNAAYKPTITQLDARGKAIAALDAKQAADETSFQQWLVGRASMIDAQARAADQTLASQQQKIADDNKANWAGAARDSMARAADTAGNVSDVHDSTALNGTAAAQHSNEMVENNRALTAQITRNSETQRGTANEAILAAAAAASGTRAAATNKALSDVASERTKALTSRAADLEGEVARLFDKEIEKAEYNTDTGIAADKLGVEQQKISATISNNNKKLRLENRRLDIEQFKADNQKAYNDAKTQIGYDRIKSTSGQKAADRAMRKWIAKYNAHHKTKAKVNDQGMTSAEVKTQQDAYKTVETLRSSILGMKQRGKNDHWIRKHFMNQGYDSVSFDVANDLVTHNGKLSAHGIAKARNLGIPHPRQLWG